MHNFTENIGVVFKGKRETKPLSLQTWSSSVLVDVRLENPTNYFWQLEVKSRGGNYKGEHAWQNALNFPCNETE